MEGLTCEGPLKWIPPSGIIPAFGTGPKAWTYLSLPGRSDRPLADVIPLSGHDSTAQFEDELPVRQLVTLVGVLDDVRQLADV